MSSTDLDCSACPGTAARPPRCRHHATEPLRAPAAPAGGPARRHPSRPARAPSAPGVHRPLRRRARGLRLRPRVRAIRPRQHRPHRRHLTLQIRRLAVHHRAHRPAGERDERRDLRHLVDEMLLADDRQLAAVTQREDLVRVYLPETLGHRVPSPSVALPDGMMADYADAQEKPARSFGRTTRRPSRFIRSPTLSMCARISGSHDSGCNAASRFFFAARASMISPRCARAHGPT
jgi:hypothetical protein